MATTARILFKNNTGNFIASIHCAQEGYPESLGKNLLESTKGEFMKGILSNSRFKKNEAYDGFGCYVASFISTIKKTVGDVYMTPDTKDYSDCGENYVYEVVENSDGDGVEIFVFDPHKKEFHFLRDVILERYSRLN